jgi:hypothetical protein
MTIVSSKNIKGYIYNHDNFLLECRRYFLVFFLKVS